MIDDDAYHQFRWELPDGTVMREACHRHPDGKPEASAASPIPAEFQSVLTTEMLMAITGMVASDPAYRDAGAELQLNSIASLYGEDAAAKADVIHQCAIKGITLDGEPILLPSYIWDAPEYPTISNYLPAVCAAATGEVLAVHQTRQIYNSTALAEKHIGEVLAGEASLYANGWQPPQLHQRWLANPSSPIPDRKEA